MEPDRNKLRAIFDEVFQAPPEARPALLAERCADDDELRRRVEALIEIADSDDPFLANPTVAIPRIPRDQERVPLLSSSADDEVPLLLSSAGDQAPNASPASPRQPNNADDHASTLAASPITETAGVRVGRYKLLQQIGEGGFGTVFMAEQERPVRRRVALKIIKLGMDTRQVVARFEAERQALALMDHPHIARVLDAGATDSGRPFFVMEYVVGDPITNFADAHKLDVRQRLDLFAQVCQAVQHAHTKGVIHRDLKPHNVLVSMSDGRPFAKVIDFGIAKATGARLTDKTFFTEHRQLIGTPEYMSPEQAEGSPDIDTRTDVYALGVLLYELLTGATPFDAKRLRSAAFAEMQRIIKEEEPPAPSVRLSRSLETLAETAAARQAEPDKLSGLVRGELDWIVMKALDKDRARRYESPNQLAADVMRHLAGEAVVAAPPGVGYRVRKFVRRNRGAVLTGAFVTLILICSTLVMAIFYRRAELARQGEASQRAIADKQRQAAELEAYAANISEAQMAMAANKWPEAKDKLNQCPAAFQSWEWQLLKLKADGIRYAIPNLDQVVPCQVSPILLAISRDSAQIINVNSGAQIGVPIRHGDRITAAEFSPDGKQFLTTGVDSRVRLWSISGVPIGEPIRQEGSDLKAHFSPDGQRILTMSSGSFPCLWDLSGRRVGEPLERTNLHRWAFSPDGNRLITLSRHENDVKIWNCRSAVQLGNAITFSSGASNLCISGDGRLVSIALSDGGIGIWEIESSREINRLPDSDGLYGMEFSKDSRQLLVSGSGQIAVFDISGVDNATAILWEIKDAQRAEYSPDGSEVLVTMKYGATLRDAVSGEAIGKPIRLPGNNRKYTFVAEGDYVLAESSCCVQLWNRMGMPVCQPIWYDDEIPGCRAIIDPVASVIALVSPRGAKLFARDGTYVDGVKFPDFHVPAGEDTPPVQARLDDSGALDYVFCNSMLVAFSLNQPSWPEWRIPYSEAMNENLKLAVLDELGWVDSLFIDRAKTVVTRDGLRRIEARADRSIRFVGTTSGRELATIRLDDVPDALELSPDGARLVIRFAGGDCLVWDFRPWSAQQLAAKTRESEFNKARDHVDNALENLTVRSRVEQAILSDADTPQVRKTVLLRALDRRLAELAADVESYLAELSAQYVYPAEVLRVVSKPEFAVDLDKAVREIVRNRVREWMRDPALLDRMAWADAQTPGVVKDRIALAYEAASSAVDLNSTNASYQLTLGAVLCRLERFGESMEVLDRARRLFKQSGTEEPAVLSGFRAIVALRLEAFDEARAELDRLKAPKGSTVDLLEGEIDGRKMKFRYSEDGEWTGEGSFELSEDGKAFTGSYSEYGDSTSYPWNAVRKSGEDLSRFDGIWNSDYGYILISTDGAKVLALNYSDSLLVELVELMPEDKLKFLKALVAPGLFGYGNQIGESVQGPTLSDSDNDH